MGNQEVKLLPVEGTTCWVDQLQRYSQDSHSCYQIYTHRLYYRVVQWGSHLSQTCSLCIRDLHIKTPSYMPAVTLYRREDPDRMQKKAPSIVSKIPVSRSQVPYVIGDQ
ncbi:UNVERIFIED_CONTAM: hypothetical protein K2H54_071370 [Gekko kuhli]